MNNFEVRNGHFEASVVVKKHFEASVVVKKRMEKARTKKSGRLLTMEKLSGSVRKETIAVSVTIKISVQNRHRRTLLQDLSRLRRSVFA